MKRSDEIHKASIDAGNADVIKGIMYAEAFRLGAEWADANPKQLCTHPKAKVKSQYYTALEFVRYWCECGAAVEPEGFKEV